MLDDDMSPLDDDETVTQTVTLDDRTTILGADPFRSIDVGHTLDNGDPFEPITVDETDIMRFDK